MKRSSYWYVRLLTERETRPLIVGLVNWHCTAADFHHLGSVKLLVAWRGALFGLEFCL